MRRFLPCIDLIFIVQLCFFMVSLWPSRSNAFRGNVKATMAIIMPSIIVEK